MAGFGVILVDTIATEVAFGEVVLRDCQTLLGTLSIPMNRFSRVTLAAETVQKHRPEIVLRLPVAKLSAPAVPVESQTQVLRYHVACPVMIPEVACGGA